VFGAIAITNSGTHAGVLATRLDALTVTLLSAIGSGPIAPAPIPGALLLFSTALGGIGVAGIRRRVQMRIARSSAAG
jgi:hypothetical protein